MAAKRAFEGSRCQALEGQNRTFSGIRHRIAGTRVTEAIAVTATAMASAGPSALNIPRLDRTSTAKATTTAPAAEVMASPTRPTALATASLRFSPARSRSR